MVGYPPSSTLVGRKLQPCYAAACYSAPFPESGQPWPQIKIYVFESRLVAAFAALLCMQRPAAAQDPSSIPGDPSFSNSAAWRAPSANLYISVREATGLPVNTSAMVKLSCPSQA